ncbi:MAG: hypothetical protein ABIL44_03530 [candidate division WOR-3 bacterium]
MRVLSEFSKFLHEIIDKILKKSRDKCANESHRYQNQNRETFIVNRETIIRGEKGILRKQDKLNRRERLEKPDRPVGRGWEDAPHNFRPTEVGRYRIKEIRKESPRHP